VAVQVELETERARVTYDESVTDLDAVRSAISELGYGASVYEVPPEP
jgi:copper chaperone CopZ